MPTTIESLWIDDQVVAALRLQSTPLAVKEICRLICGECQRTSHYHHYGRVYNRLRRLARLGVVVRHPWNGTASLFSIPPVAYEDCATLARRLARAHRHKVRVFKRDGAWRIAVR